MTMNYNTTSFLTQANGHLAQHLAVDAKFVVSFVLEAMDDGWKTPPATVLDQIMRGRVEETALRHGILVIGARLVQIIYGCTTPKCLKLIIYRRISKTNVNDTYLIMFCNRPCIYVS